MDASTLLIAVDRQDTKAQEVFYASLAAHLTIVARNQYRSASSTRSLFGQEAVNEVQNKVCAQLLSIVSSGKTAYPPQSLVDVITEWANKAGIRGEIDWAFREAEADARRRGFLS